MEFPWNTYLFSYTDRKTDRLTGGKTDRQAERQTDQHVNELKHFVGGWGDCGYGVDGRIMHLGKQKGR